MRHPLPPLPQALIWRRRMMAFAAVSLLGGCAVHADFDEVRPLGVSNEIHEIQDWFAPVVNTGSVSPHFDLTDDERQMRELARPLIDPPFTSQPWYSVLVEIGLIKPARVVRDRTTYATRLLASQYHSPSARYAQLSDDVHNDITRMPQFFETAGRVLDMDEKRHKSLAYVSVLTPVERKKALRRIHENESLVELVRAKLVQRAASYRFALERLVITTPSPRAVDIERAITQMLAEIDRYRQPAPTWIREQNLATAR